MRGQSYFPIFSQIHRATLFGELVASFPAACGSDQETASPTLILRSAQRARLEGWPRIPEPGQLMVRDGAARLLTMRGQSYFPIFSHIHRATLSGELVASFAAARRLAARISGRSIFPSNGCSAARRVSSPARFGASNMIAS
jgi:hypothetical protein